MGGGTRDATMVLPAAGLARPRGRCGWVRFQSAIGAMVGQISAGVDNPAAFARRGTKIQFRACWSSCSPSFQRLRIWSFPQPWGDSIFRMRWTNCIVRSMSKSLNRSTRERRWILLAQEGSHAWLGRATDPEEDDVGRAEASLRRSGVGGWLAVCEGDYWSMEPIKLLEVRALNRPSISFAEATGLFLERRRNAVQAGS